jgi:diguanylate cyclase (GGDEF)-like protein
MVLATSHDFRTRRLSRGQVKLGFGRPMYKQTESVLGRVGQQLSQLERRDWELWVIVSLTGVPVGTGLLAILFPAAFLKQDNVHFEVTVSRPLAVGLIALLLLLNTYLVSKRLEIRRVREALISSTIQRELVRQQSFTDPLTEIYNRHSLEDMAGRFISHARRLKSSLSLVMIDVDRFKDVNTRFGHLTGDVVLADIAALLKKSVRGSDAVFRYGGDEFLIILADTSRAGAAQVVERIRAYLLEWNRAGNLHGFELGLSIGVSEWSDGMTLDDLLDQADREMYGAKSDHIPDRARPRLVRATAQKIEL